MAADGFASWLARLTDQSDPAKTIDVGKHRCTYRWIVESDRVLGGIALRHGSDDYVLWAGHIGYGIRPSARRRGLATWALGRMLDEARALGLDRLLAVCAVDNVASVRTIERCGGGTRSFCQVWSTGWQNKNHPSGDDGWFWLLQIMPGHR